MGQVRAGQAGAGGIRGARGKEWARWGPPKIREMDGGRAVSWSDGGPGRGPGPCCHLSGAEGYLEGQVTWYSHEAAPQRSAPGGSNDGRRHGPRHAHHRRAVNT